MTGLSLMIRRRLEIPCTIDIEHTETSLHAHVELQGALVLRPGDRVRVNGAPIRVRFGDKMILHRSATVERAGWLERQWTRFAARFEVCELYDVSFTQGRL